MKTEKNYYMPPVLEFEEVEIEQGFATSLDGAGDCNRSSSYGAGK